MQAQPAPPLAHLHHEDPARPGLHAALEGEEVEHHHGHEKKPVLRKVKEKVKTHGLHGDGGGGDHDAQWDEEVSEEEGGNEEDDVGRVEDSEVHGRVVEPKVAYSRDGGILAGGEPEMIGVEDAPLGDAVGSLKEDPAAPRSGTSMQIDPERGGEEIGMSPVIEAFESMVVSDQLPSSISGSQPTEGTYQESYTEKLSTTARAAASAVYEKVAEAGGAVMEKGTAVVEKVQQGGTESGDTSSRTPSRGVKGYLAEKLKPADEDRALSEAITETLRKGNRKEGAAPAAATGSGGGVGIMGKIREAVTSFAGGGIRPSPATEAERKAMEDTNVRQEEVRRQEKDLE